MSLNLCSEHGWAVLDWRLVTGETPPGFPPYMAKPATYVHRHHYEGAVRVYFEDWSEAYWECRALNGLRGLLRASELQARPDLLEEIERDERRSQGRTEPSYTGPEEWIHCLGGCGTRLDPARGDWCFLCEQEIRNG